MQLCHDGMAAYASAVGLLAVHSAISYNDAVLIKLTGRRSRRQAHEQAVTEVTKACKKAKIQTDGIKHLDRLVHAKTDVSYGDKEVDSQKVEFLYVAAERFQAWAERLLGNDGRRIWL
jgi:transcriptional regulator NrdR family protein